MPASKADKLQAHQELWNKALAAGQEAGNSATPTPMIVGSPSTPFGNDIDPNKPVYVIREGACGFAWVTVRPGNCSFARWLKDTSRARPAYDGGVSIWISDYNQSMTRKEAHALAMSKVLQAAGIDAVSGSRLD